MKLIRPSPHLAEVMLTPRANGTHEVTVCFQMSHPMVPHEARTVLALDASRSMKPWFGSQHILLRRPNSMQPVARALGSILADVASNGQVEILYWALDNHGDGLEKLGSFFADQLSTLSISGPSAVRWGHQTRLLPIVRHIVEEWARGSGFTLAALVCDGRIEDEAEVVAYCLHLGQEIAAGQRGVVQFVLLGIGDDLDEAQLYRLEDMFKQTPLAEIVNMWSTCRVADLGHQQDIVNALFSPALSPETLVASTGSIWVDEQPVVHYRDGLPAKIRFLLPAGATAFTIQTPQGSIHQDLTAALASLHDS